MNQIIYKDRTNANSRKFSGLKEKFGRDDLIPLWIADMDFEVPKCVTDGLREYIDFGVFGYYDPTDEYFNAIIDWEEKYQNYQIKKEWIRYAPGVVPAFNWLIHNLTKENDSVIIMAPVYYPFGEGIVNNNRNIGLIYLVSSFVLLREASCRLVHSAPVLCA